MRAQLSRLGFLVPFLALYGVGVLVHQQHVRFGDNVLADGLLPPFEYVVLGLVQGCIVALLAVGIALVFRANRIINFAQAELGNFSATFASLLILSAGWNFYLAMVTGLLGSILVGGLVEFLFVRRFFRAPRLILTVATIGIAQVLTGLGLLLATRGPLRDPSDTSWAPPISLSFTIGPTTFSASEVFALIVTPLILAGLAVFLRRSAVGIGIRASAESADRAALLGIPVKRIQTYVWVLASVLGFVAMFMRASIVGPGFGDVLAPSTLLAALAAAAIGRMERFPTIVSAALGICVLDRIVDFEWEVQAYRDAVLAVVVAAAVLLVRRRSTSRVAAGSVSTWQATREIRPVPHELAHLAEVRAVRWGGLVLVVALLASLPAWLADSDVKKAGAIGIYAMIAVSLVVLSGWAGQISLGQVAVVGLAGAAAGSVTTNSGGDLAVAILVGAVVGAVVMVLVGLPALRAGGLALGITTLGLALVTSSYLLNDVYSPFADRLPSFGVNAETPALFGRIYPDTSVRFYWLIVVALGLTLLCVHRLRRTRTGRVLIGMRENERAAQTYGLSPRRAAINALAISGAIAGIAGALFVHQQLSLDLGPYRPEEGLKVFSMVVVGGLGSIGGAVLGAVAIRMVDWFITGDWAFLSFLASGAGMLIVLILLPGGLGAAVGQLRDAWLRRVARRRGIRVPSLLADTRVQTDYRVTEEMAEAVADVNELDVHGLEGDDVEVRPS